MKTCPKCHRTFDDSLSFCLEDGTTLSLSFDDEMETVLRTKSTSLDRSSVASGNNKWKQAFLILVPALITGLLVILFFTQRWNDNRNIASNNPIDNGSNRNAINASVNSVTSQADQDISSNSNNSSEGRETSVLVPKRKDRPKFSDYPVAKWSGGRNAAVKLATAQERMYKTHLREASLKPANFAGHYILSWFGCGTNCAHATLIDAPNGVVFWFPETVNYALWADEPDGDIVGYRLNSKLLVFYTLDNSGAGFRRYYVFENNRFNLVYSVKAPRAF